MKSKRMKKKRGHSTSKVTIPDTHLGSGVIAFWISHAQADWAVNNENYKFGPIENDNASVSAFKKSDLSLEVRFMTSNFGHTFSATIPEPFEKGVHVAVTWTPEEITLRLNNRAVSSVLLKPTTR